MHAVRLPGARRPRHRGAPPQSTAPSGALERLIGRAAKAAVKSFADSEDDKWDKRLKKLVSDQDKKHDAKFNEVHSEIKEMKDDFNKKLQVLSVNGTEWMGEETTLVAFYTYPPHRYV